MEIEDLGTFQAEPDTFLCIPKGHAARFSVKGDEPSVRISIRQPDAQTLPATGAPRPSGAAPTASSPPCSPGAPAGPPKTWPPTSRA